MLLHRLQQLSNKIMLNPMAPQPQTMNRLTSLVRLSTPAGQIDSRKVTLKAHVCVVVLLFSFRLITAKEPPINYLNEKPPGMVARIFAPGVLSTEALEHSSPAFSPDGKTVVWAVMKMPSYQICLLEMNFADNKWSAAQAPAFADTAANEVYPTFSADGDTLYFSSNRSDIDSSIRNQTLWYVIRRAGGWSEPAPLDTNVFEKDIYANSVTKSGNKYVTVGPPGTMDWNIFTTKGADKMNPLPSHINAKGYEDGPFIAADESYLIFESDRPTVMEGGIDLYISFRKKDGTWAEPLNMGPEVNSAWSERFAKVSPDGKYLFFGRNTGNGFDIYWIASGIIDQLKKQAAKSGLLK
jgi:Tol biopolymer transport system component